MKYLFWRGNSLWCRYPAPGFSETYPLEVYTTGSTADRNRCRALGERLLACIRVAVAEGKKFRLENGGFFEIKTVEAPAKEKYNPSFCALCLRYWFDHLAAQKCSADDAYHLQYVLKSFGPRPALQIFRADVDAWREDQKRAGYAINTINNRYAYFKAVFSWANREDNPEFRIDHDPTRFMEKLPGGKVRTFLLTPEKFERNYQYFLTGEKWPHGKPDKHCTPYMVPPTPRFALFYLLCWETGRRPMEAAQYTWNMVNEVEINGRTVHFFSVPPELAKTDTFDNVVISDRLWSEMKALAYRQGFICRNVNGGPWQYWDRYQRALEKKYGADGGWIRDTRRGFVTRKIVSEGFDERLVMMQSGHHTRETIKRYRVDQLRDQARIMATSPALVNLAAVV